MAVVLSKGHLYVYLDGRLIRECIGPESRWDHAYYTFEEDVSALPEGVHTVEFKLMMTGDEQDHWGVHLTASSILREVPLVEGEAAPFTWTSPEAVTAKPIKEVLVQTNAYALGSSVSISTDGGATWVPVKSTDLGRPLSVMGGPHRVMVRIEDIPRFPAGDYEYHLIAFPGPEPVSLSTSSGLVATYTYDHAGNRVRETINGQAAVYEYHPHSDRLWKKDGLTFTYDPNGNLIEKDTPEGRWNYLYDYATGSPPFTRTASSASDIYMITPACGSGPLTRKAGARFISTTWRVTSSRSARAKRSGTISGPWASTWRGWME